MTGRLTRRRTDEKRGQALVEFALAAPLFFMVLVGVIVLGIIVFYNQQLSNAAREAARFASVHSASAQCPVVSTLAPAGFDSNTGHTGAVAPPISYLACDAPPTWPELTAYSRSKVFGLDPANVMFTVCWSGYRTGPEDVNYPNLYDAPPTEWFSAQDPPIADRSEFAQCDIDGVDPMQDANSIGCPGGSTADTASSISEGQGRIVANLVTAYACYEWAPPMAGFLLIPETVTFRAVISEPIERQQ